MGLSSRPKILKLIHYNTTLQHYVNAWQNGQITWEDAMMCTVEALTKHNEELIQKAIKLGALQTPTYVLKSKED